MLNDLFAQYVTWFPVILSESRWVPHVGQSINQSILCLSIVTVFTYLQSSEIYKKTL